MRRPLFSFLIRSAFHEESTYHTHCRYDCSPIGFRNQPCTSLLAALQAESNTDCVAAVPTEPRIRALLYLRCRHRVVVDHNFPAISKLEQCLRPDTGDGSRLEMHCPVGDAHCEIGLQ
jgi:hypothetical protein